MFLRLNWILSSCIAIKETINTVDPAIFPCLNLHEFPILRLFTKFRIREFSFCFSSAVIIIIILEFLNS